MVSKKQLAILLLITSIFFGAYLIKPTVMGFDSYAYLLQTCTGFNADDRMPLTPFIFGAIPCNIIAIKLILFGLCFSTVVGIAKMGETIVGEDGWLAGIFVWLSPIIAYEFASFENDMFAFPLLIWATYFFLKGASEQSNGFRRFKWIGIALLLILFSAGIWGGSLYYPFAFMFDSLIFAGAALVAAILFGGQLFSAMIGNPDTMEGTNMVAWIYWFILVLGLAGFVSKRERARHAILPLMVFMFLGLRSIKFGFHAIALLSVGLVFVVQRLDEKFPKLGIKSTAIMLSFILAISWGIAVQEQPPTQEHLDTIRFAVEQSPNGSVQNDWDLGYWVMWVGGDTNAFGGPRLQVFHNGIVVSRHPQDCTLLKEMVKKNMLVADERLGVYRC